MNNKQITPEIDTSDPEELMPATQIAAELGVNPATISRWRKLPGAPQRVNGKDSFSEWCEFAARRDKELGRHLDREKLECEKLEIQIRTAKIKLELLESKYIPTADFHEFRDHLRAALVRAFRDSARGLPRRLAGKEAPAIRSQLKIREDEIIGIIHNG